MSWFDYAVLAVVLISALLGWWRGLVYEILSLLGWAVAWMVARVFTAAAAPYMPDVLGVGTAKVAAAFVALFVVSLVVWAILAWLLSKLVKLVGLGWLDGLMGGVFGVLRGLVVLLVLVVLAGLTPLPQQKFWREAWSSKPLTSMALAAQGWLPDTVARHMHY